MFKNKQGFSDVIVMTIIGGIIGSLFILGVFVWQEADKVSYFNSLYYSKKVEKVVEQPGDNKNPGKISYGSDVSNEAEYRSDCESKGGKFNPCDSACAPGAICIQACVLTCDLSGK